MKQVLPKNYLCHSLALLLFVFNFVLPTQRLEIKRKKALRRIVGPMLLRRPCILQLTAPLSLPLSLLHSGSSLTPPHYRTLSLPPSPSLSPTHTWIHLRITEQKKLLFCECLSEEETKRILSEQQILK